MPLSFPSAVDAAAAVATGTEVPVGVGVGVGVFIKTLEIAVAVAVAVVLEVFGGGGAPCRFSNAANRYIASWETSVSLYRVSREGKGSR